MNAQTKTKRADGANGSLPILLTFPMARTRIDILGGPYDGFKPHINASFGVCVRAEKSPSRPADVRLAINDFSVPADEDYWIVESALKRTFAAAMRGEVVWVGCMGGFGRTGLFLALMAKAAGIEDPVAYVRQFYYPHAVETDEQQVYVEDFDVGGLRTWLIWHSWTQFAFKAVTWWK